MSILDEILAHKRQEVEALRRAPGEAALRDRASAAAPPRDFSAALRNGPGPRIISEFKRRSPSKGVIREGAKPEEIARAYQEAGAAALSVLTDERFFGGSLGDLQAARGACSLPVLRKDFTIDPIQLFEARAAGADAVLLIVAALGDEQLGELHATSEQLDLAALVEVHTAEELERAQTVGAGLIGINNRDLTSFETDVGVTRRLLAHAGGATIVSESGLADPEVVDSLMNEGVHAFLVGEALMREPDPGAALRRLRGSP
jgi:indole-3-glycerol phosphate synthase